MAGLELWFPNFLRLALLDQLNSDCIQMNVDAKIKDKIL